jgi:DNA polymerase III epsilon subunit-like protein
MLRYFSTRWDEVPVACIDTETTGPRPGIDRAVSVAIVRFEGRVPVDSVCSLVDPGIPIPADATAIHGITNEAVAGATTITEFFAAPRTQQLLADAQPCAYHASFDRAMVPPFGDIDSDWPWLDPLVVVRKLDEFTPGTGRHRLEVAAQRHGIPLDKAHEAESDARAAGQLFYHLVPKLPRIPPDLSLGRLLRWQMMQAAREWFRFNDWIAAQLPLESR